MNYKNALCVSIALMFIGCASGTKFTSAVQPTNDTARLYVFRPSSPPYLYKPTIYINGIKVAELSNKGYFDVNIKSGTYNLRSEWSMFSGVVGRITDIEFKVESGKTYYAKIATTVNAYGMYIAGVAKNITEIIDSSSAMPIIVECELVEKYADAENQIGPK